MQPEARAPAGQLELPKGARRGLLPVAVAVALRSHWACAGSLSDLEQQPLHHHPGRVPQWQTEAARLGAGGATGGAGAAYHDSGGAW